MLPELLFTKLDTIRHKDIFIIVNRYCSFYRLRACPKESSYSPVTPLTWFRSEI